jgi:hypothetical protein
LPLTAGRAIGAGRRAVAVGAPVPVMTRGRLRRHRARALADRTSPATRSLTTGRAETSR